MDPVKFDEMYRKYAGFLRFGTVKYEIDSIDDEETLEVTPDRDPLGTDFSWIPISMSGLENSDDAFFCKIQFDFNAQAQDLYFYSVDNVYKWPFIVRVQNSSLPIRITNLSGGTQTTNFIILRYLEVQNSIFKDPDTLEFLHQILKNG